jgi:hypothetical protein
LEIERFDSLKKRFRSEHRKSFYYGHANSTRYDAKSASVLRGAPSDRDFAKHPQRGIECRGYREISDQLALLL